MMVELVSIPSLAVLAAISAFVYSYVIYPSFISPLSRIPNAHFTSSISDIWISWQRYRWQANRAIHAAHVKHGPIVRLGSNEISVNCVDNGIRTIYLGGMEKHEFYSLFENYNTPPMFALLDSKTHSQQKRMLSNTYSKSFIQSSETYSSATKEILFKRLLPGIDRKISSHDGAVDVYALFIATAMDSMTAFQFGLSNSSNLIDDEEEAAWWRTRFISQKPFAFWPQEYPRLTQTLAKFFINLVPSHAVTANDDLESWTLGLCKAAEQSLHNANGLDSETHPENSPVVYKQFRNASMKSSQRKENSDGDTLSPESKQFMTIASEMFDHLAAGQETSGITLTYLFHELAQRPKLQLALQEELRTLAPSLLAQDDLQPAQRTLPSPKTIDNLPLLHAVIMETLRLHAAIPGSQPRLTGPGASLCGYDNLPAGVRVSAQAYSLHRNADVFPNPLSWLPERWLSAEQGGTTTPEQRAEMNRWFWAFGSGGRMCVGSNFAMQTMKTLTATLLSNYTTSILDDAGIEQEDAYTAHPIGKKLILRFDKIKRQDQNDRQVSE